MNNLMDLLKGQLTENVLDNLGRQLGGSSREQTATAANVALNTLMNALRNQGQNQGNLSSLVSALEKDHDGGILDNIGDLISGSTNSKSADGMGILKHLLGGNNIFNVVEMISKSSGMNRNNSMGMLMKLAPMVLGTLGKQKKTQQMDASSLMNFLNNSVQQEKQRNSQSQGLIEKMLDRDGDGSVMDEVASMGMSILGNMFRR